MYKTGLSSSFLTLPVFYLLIIQLFFDNLSFPGQLCWIGGFTTQLPPPEVSAMSKTIENSVILGHGIVLAHKHKAAENAHAHGA